MKITLPALIMVALPSLVVAAGDDSNITIVNLLTDPNGWSSWAPRPEVAPEFGIKKPSREGGNTVFTIDSGGIANTNGCWQHPLPALQKGRSYRFEAAFEVKGVERIGQHVWAIISKSDWQFQELDHDGMLGSRGRMSLELSPEEDHRDLALRLYLAWAPQGSIRWVEARVIDVTEQRAEKRRVKLAAVSGRPRKGCSSAEALEFYCQRLDAVGAQGVDLVCLPEFINKDRIEADLPDVAEPIPGGTWVSRFARKAREHGMYIAAGLIERDGRQIYNAGVLIGRDGTLVGKYRKTHPTVAESLLQGTAPGDSYSVFDTDIGKIGYMICFDNHQPEVARILAVKGAEIIVFPNGSDGREGGSLYEPYMRTRALDNQVHIVAAVNLPGQTCIVTPRGELAARADNAPGAIAIATCDLSTRVRDGSGRQIEARYMRVRRADTFAPILREYWERNVADEANLSRE